MTLWLGQVALVTAVKYALMRRQFGTPERLLMDYPIHMHRLMPRMAACYVYTAAFAVMKDLWVEAQAAGADLAAAASKVGGHCTRWAVCRVAELMRL